MDNETKTNWFKFDRLKIFINLLLLLWVASCVKGMGDGKSTEDYVENLVFHFVLGLPAIFIVSIILDRLIKNRKRRKLIKGSDYQYKDKE